MATADSVFTKVAADLLSGALPVGQLELIRSHGARFLDIWELSECGPPAAEGDGGALTGFPEAGL